MKKIIIENYRNINFIRKQECKTGKKKMYILKINFQKKRINNIKITIEKKSENL